MFFKRFLFCITCVAVMMAVSACANVPQPMTAVIFSANEPENLLCSSLRSDSYQPSFFQNNSQPDFSLAVEQYCGYQYVEEDAVSMTQTPSSILWTLTHQLENDPDKDLTTAVRELIEGKELDKNGQHPVISLLGATSNESSMSLANLSNAFKVPMIIPSSLGDNLLSSNNLWVFQLSAPGTSHAQHFFRQILNRVEVSSFSKDESELEPTESTLQTTPPPFKIAILYEKGAFGENAAVAAAREAMEQGIAIGFYGYFDPSNLDPNILEKQAKTMQEQGIHLAYLISSQPKVSRTLVTTIRNVFTGQAPILLGQSGAFAGREFLGYQEARGVFVLRQKIVTGKGCPQKLKYLAEAQSYAAFVLLRSAVKSGIEKINTSQTFEQKRDVVRTELRKFDADLNCLGRVSFNNAGQNKNLEFEILEIPQAGGDPKVIDKADFLKKLISIYNGDNADPKSPFDID